MLGVASAVLRAVGGTLPPPSAELISRWKLDEASGTIATDQEGHSDGTYTNVAPEQEPLVDGDPGTSVRFFGNSAVAVPHAAAYEVESYSLVVYGQVQSGPGPGANAMLVQKDRPSLPGGFQLGIVNDSGALRLQVYTKNESGSAFWVGSPAGVGQVVPGAAFMLVMTCGGNGTRLYLDKAEIGSTNNHVGLVENDEQIGIGRYRPGIADTAGFNGWIDEVRFYQGVLTDDEIAALPEAQSIAPADPFPEATGTSFANLGTTFSTAFLNDGGSTIYDCTGTVWDNTYNAGNNTYSPSFNIRFGANHNGGGAFGGTIINGYAPSLGDGSSRRYPANDAGQLYIRDRHVHNFFIDGWRMHHCWDPIRFGSLSGITVSNVTIRRCWISQSYDDVIENDTGKDGVVVDDCLLAGFYSGISNRPGGSADHSDRVMTIKNSLLRLRPTYPQQQHGMFFKLVGDSLQFDLFDNIFRVDQPGFPRDGNPFSDLAVVHNKLRNSSGNVIVWGGGGDYPYDPPPGFTVTTAMSVWSAAVAAWKTAHPGVYRIPGVD